MQEQRRFKRVQFRNPVQFHFEEGPGQGKPPSAVPEGAVSCDLGEGGIRMYVNDFISSNKTLALNFQLEPEQTLGLTGRVVWAQRIPHSENYQVGVEFADTLNNRPSRDAIAQYLKKS